jgi:hypothetical protein
MRKILFLLFLATQSFPATNTWSSSGSTDGNLGSNWSLGSISNTDTIVLDATSVVNCTKSAAWSVAKLSIDTAYTGTFADGGFTDTVSGAISLRSGGTETMTGRLVQDADGNVVLSGKTKTMTSLILQLMGTGTISGSSTTLKQLDFAYSGKTTTTNVAFTANGAAATPCVVLNGGTLTFGASVGLNMSSAVSCKFLQYNSATTINANTSTLVFSTTSNGVSDTLDSLRINSGTGNVTFRVNNNGGTGTLTVLGKILGAGSILSGSLAGGTNKEKTTVNFNDSVKCVAFTFGNVQMQDTSFIFFNNSKFVCTGKMAGTGSGVDSGRTTLNLGSANFDLSNSFDLGINDTVIQGTSTINFLGASGQYIRARSQTLYDIVIATGSGVRVMDSSALKCHNFTRTIGCFALGGSNLTHSGNLVVNSAGATDSLLGRIVPDTIKSTGGGLFQITTSGVILIDSTVLWLANGGETVNLSVNIAMRGMILTANKHYTFQAGKTLTFNKFTNIANNDTLASTSAGNAAIINIPAIQAVTGGKYTDITITGQALFDTAGTAYNGGGNTGITFDNLVFSSIKPDSITTVGGLCTLTVVHGRTSGGSLTVGGASTAISSQATAKWIYTAPAHAAGTVAVIGDNGGNLKDTINMIYYTPASTTSSITSGVWAKATHRLLTWARRAYCKLSFR